LAGLGIAATFFPSQDLTSANQILGAKALLMRPILIVAND
jgi:hypothetical protein